MSIPCRAQSSKNAVRGASDVPRDEYILVVDDDPVISDLVAMVLRDEEGYVIELASTLRQVLAQPPEHAPRMVFLDANLPGENVLQTSADLRRLPGWRETPIVLCSGRDDIVQMAREMDAAAYLKKPFDIDELIALAGAFAR